MELLQVLCICSRGRCIQDPPPPGIWTRIFVKTLSLRPLGPRGPGPPPCGTLAGRPPPATKGHMDSRAALPPPHSPRHHGSWTRGFPWAALGPPTPGPTRIVDR